MTYRQHWHRMSQQEKEERRAYFWQLAGRGLRLKQISQKAGVSIAQAWRILNGVR